MIIDQNNGADILNTSKPTSTGTVFADLQAPPVVMSLFRLGGALGISVGTALAIDTVDEPVAGSGTSYVAQTASTGLFGRQVVATTGATSANASFHNMVGIYTGIGNGNRGPYNMPAATGPTIAIASLAPTNQLSYQVSTTTKVAGQYAIPGDLILVTRSGPAVAWVDDTNATTAGASIANIGTVAPPNGGLSLSSIAGKAVVSTMDNPTTAVTSGIAMACRVYCYLL